MMVGPSGSVDKHRLQTIFMLLRLKAAVVSDKGKGIAEMSGELQ